MRQLTIKMVVARAKATLLISRVAINKLATFVAIFRTGMHACSFHKETNIAIANRNKDHHAT